ncbi:glycosyltransferase family 39 protein [bacterium]|nr:glycosyltransferase family 39 protein [bacterium]
MIIGQRGETMPARPEPQRPWFALSALNSRASARPVVWALAAIVFVGGLLHYLLPLARSGQLGALIQGGDGPDYDTLAVQISKGHGCVADWDDPDFRAPYEKASAPDRPHEVLSRHGAGPRTSRPPLLPAMMAVCFRLFGRDYGPVRVLMCLCMALAATAAFGLLARRFGIVPGLAAAAWFIFDPRSTTYTQMILTEAPSCLVVMLWAWALVVALERRTPGAACWLGVAAGVAFYTRTVFTLWIPVVALVVYLFTKPPTARWWSAAAVRLPALSLAVFLVVSGPWMLRNCVVLGYFEPLGTMGDSSLAAAYSDEALAKKGVWFNLSRAGFFDGVLPPHASPAEHERVTAQYSRQQALAWIAHNPGKLPRLARLKAADLWRPTRGLWPIPLLISAGLGALAALRAAPHTGITCLTFLTACTLAVAVTWSVGGDRFLVPVLPIVMVLAGLGTWATLLAATELSTDRLGVDQRSRVDRA